MARSCQSNNFIRFALILPFEHVGLASLKGHKAVAHCQAVLPQQAVAKSHVCLITYTGLVLALSSSFISHPPNWGLAPTHTPLSHDWHRACHHPHNHQSSARKQYHSHHHFPSFAWDIHASEWREGETQQFLKFISLQSACSQHMCCFLRKDISSANCCRRDSNLSSANCCRRGGRRNIIITVTRHDCISVYACSFLLLGSIGNLLPT